MRVLVQPARQRVSISGIDLDGARERVMGLVQLSDGYRRMTKTEPGFRMAGLKEQNFVVCLLRFRDMPHQPERIAQIVQRVAVAWLGFQYFSVALYCVGKFARLSV